MAPESSGSASHEAGRAERRRLKREYRTLFDEVSASLFERDPMGINGGTNTDEYDMEAAAILPWLAKANSPAHVRLVLEAVLRKYFGSDWLKAKPKLDALAAEIWQAKQRHGWGE